MTPPPIRHSQDRLNFEEWFGSSLERLIRNPAAGFICAMVAFPLLERYLCRVSSDEPSSPAFNNALLNFMSELGTVEAANRFWGVYRHGLLHAAELQRRGDWLSHETPIVIRQGDRFCMNPARFAERVLEKIRLEFDKYALQGLPQVESVTAPSTLGISGSTYIGTGSR
jgi:hypothetical protein